MPNEIDVDTWEAFEDRLNEFRNHRTTNEPSAPALHFRGHANSRWSLSTTLERNKKPAMLFKDYYRAISVLRPEIETFTSTQWAIPTYPEVEKLVQDYDPFSLALTFGPHPAYDYMIYLRHHGFPSPLLDWTRSVHVAAYFAFNNAGESGAVSIYVLLEGKFKSGSNGVPSIHRMGPYVKTHRRHFLQQSDYTMCLVFGSDSQWRFAEHDRVLTCNNVHGDIWWNYDLMKFNIPVGERLKVLKLLDEHNLNAFSLFGSEESLMETMSLRKLHFQN